MYLGFVIFIIGWIMQTVVIFGVPYASNFFLTTPLSTFLTVIFSLFPWDLLVKGFADLGRATSGTRPGACARVHVRASVPGVRPREG